MGELFKEVDAAFPISQKRRTVNTETSADVAGDFSAERRKWKENISTEFRQIA